MADSATVWWSSRRRAYNVARVVAGLLAFICYAFAINARCSADDTVEITLFAIAFQGIGYLIAMLIANAFYNLGAWSERQFSPSDPGAFRRLTFKMGLVFSIALPFVVPGAIWMYGC